MFYSIKESEVILNIKAQPGASKNEFSQLYGDAIKIRIKAAPVEGAANKELIKFISKSFKVPKNSIEFISGETSKVKKIKFPLTDKFQEFIKKYKSE